MALDSFEKIVKEISGFEELSDEFMSDLVGKINYDVMAQMIADEKAGLLHGKKRWSGL